MLTNPSLLCFNKNKKTLYSIVKYGFLDNVNSVWVVVHEINTMVLLKKKTTNMNLVLYIEK